MHIASHGIVRRSLYAAFCGYRYAAYWDVAGVALVIARKSDGQTILLQGDDATSTERELDMVCTAQPETDEGEMVDRILEQYDAIKLWDEFAISHCAPSSDLMLLNYY